MTIMEDNVSSFLDSLIDEKGFSENTVMAYKNDLHQLADFVRSRSINSWAKIDQTLLMDYFLTLKERSYA